MATPRVQMTVGAVLTAGAMVLVAPAGIALAAPGNPNANDNGCSTNCSNGAFGRGGEASGTFTDGRGAQGTLFRAPSTLFQGETISGAGNSEAGRFWITNTGSASGSFAPPPGGELLRGHQSGIFGPDGTPSGGSCSGNFTKKTCS